MTDHQKKLKSAIGAFNDAMDTEWNNLVETVNEYAFAIAEGKEHYDASFPPEIERGFDHGANRTAWIYHRLEAQTKSKRNTYVKIRKALGYYK